MLSVMRRSRAAGDYKNYCVAFRVAVKTVSATSYFLLLGCLYIQPSLI